MDPRDVPCDCGRLPACDCECACSCDCPTDDEEAIVWITPAVPEDPEFGPRVPYESA